MRGTVRTTSATYIEHGLVKHTDFDFADFTFESGDRLVTSRPNLRWPSLLIIYLHAFQPTLSKSFRCLLKDIANKRIIL